jgi:hypothetical protein
MAELPIAVADICIFKGGTFNQTLFYETGEPSSPVDLSGYTAKMQVRSKPESKAVILELSTTKPPDQFVCLLPQPTLKIFLRAKTLYMICFYTMEQLKLQCSKVMSLYLKQLQNE